MKTKIKTRVKEPSDVFTNRHTEERELNRRTASRTAAPWSCELLTSRLRHAQASPLGTGNAARRRVRRIVGVRMGLLRHDGEKLVEVSRFLSLDGERSSLSDVRDRCVETPIFSLLSGFVGLPL